MAPKADPKAKGAPKKAKAEKEEDDADRVEAPDKAVFEAQLAEIQAVIEGYQKEQSALAEKISARSGGKEAYFAERNEYKTKLDAFTEKIDDLQAKMDAIKQSETSKRQEGVDMRNQLKKMKRSIGYQSEEQIDERIATIEFKMLTESTSLMQEKAFLKEIAELKRNRPKVGDLHKMEDTLQNRTVDVNLKESKADIMEEMKLYKDGKRQVSEKLKALNEDRQKQLGDLPDLIKQREAIGLKIKEEAEKRSTLRDEFRSKEREYNEYKSKLRKARQDKQMADRAAMQAEQDKWRRQREADKLDTQPFNDEIVLIEQTILFCKSLVKDKAHEEKVEAKEVEHTNPEGTEVLLKKEDRDEFYYAPTAGKKKKNKGKKAAEGGAKPIKHNAETFKLFDKLKLTAPITTDDIPGTLEKLEESLEDYKQKVVAWEKTRDEKKAKILAGESVDDEEAGEEEGAKEEEKPAEEE